MAQTDLLSTREAAELLGVDVSTLSRWVNAREPKLLPVRSRPYLFDLADVEKLGADLEAAAS